MKIKKLAQTIGLVSILAFAGCSKKTNVWGPHQKEDEARAEIIRKEYRAELREKFPAGKPAPNYSIDRLYDKDWPSNNPVLGL